MCWSENTKAWRSSSVWATLKLTKGSRKEVRGPGFGGHPSWLFLMRQNGTSAERTAITRVDKKDRNPHFTCWQHNKGVVLGKSQSCLLCLINKTLIVSKNVTSTFCSTGTPQHSLQMILPLVWQCNPSQVPNIAPHGERSGTGTDGTAGPAEALRSWTLNLRGPADAWLTEFVFFSPEQRQTWNRWERVDGPAHEGRFPPRLCFMFCDGDDNSYNDLILVSL